MADTWRMDETYIKIKGKWDYYYRSVEKHGAIVDFYLSDARNDPAAKAFFDKAPNSSGLPSKAVVDKSGANITSLAIAVDWSDACGHEYHLLRVSLLVNGRSIVLLNMVIEQKDLDTQETNNLFLDELKEVIGLRESTTSI